ncbi:MAG: hypothetical protein WBQ44_03030 [Rhodococcus sp. (in: high G+C Gram-positive bacteria)]
MTAPENVIYLADHSVVLALPALIPAFVIVGVVLFVVARDRRAERDEERIPPEDRPGWNESTNEENT